MFMFSHLFPSLLNNTAQKTTSFNQFPDVILMMNQKLIS